jgi:hypothetical protein
MDRLLSVSLEKQFNISLMLASILAHPDPHKTFLLDTDGFWWLLPRKKRDRTTS